MGVQMIPITRLEPHPDNPRKDLGDLTELAASLRQQGVLQNLTVVPAEEGKYRIVIGHRRHAAATLTGMTELPCSVVYLPYTEQLAMMMSENMQRNELTIAERVGGVQMMMDFGMTPVEIAGRTGLGESTVRKYARMRNIKNESLSGAVACGATLMQLVEVSEVEDEELREELLKAAGTNDWLMVKNRVRRKAAEKKYKGPMIEYLSQYAEEVKFDNYEAEAVRRVDYTDNDPIGSLKAIQFDPARKYIFYVGMVDIIIRVRRQKEKKTLTPEEQRQKKESERRKACLAHEAEIAEEFARMRREWLKEAVFDPADIKPVKFAIFALSRTEYAYPAEPGGLFAGEYHKPTEEEKKIGRFEISVGEIDEIPTRRTNKAIALLAYDRTRGWSNSLMDYNGNRSERTNMPGLYEMFEQMGYPVSSEERAWLNGTHECWTYPHEEDETK